MPALEKKDRYQKAVLWNAVDGDAAVDRYGEVNVADPVEILVRWVWTETQMTNSQGDPVSVDATAVVDRDIYLGSRMWLGALADWYGTGSAFGDDFVMEVRVSKYGTDLKNRFERRTVGLVFYKDTPRNE